MDRLALARGLPSPHYGLFIASDSAQVPDDAIYQAALIAARSGLAYLSTWGPECGRVHDIFDQAIIEQLGGEYPDGRVVLTTWHSDEPLNEALWFSLLVETGWQSALATTSGLIAYAAGLIEGSESARSWNQGLPSS